MIKTKLIILEGPPGSGKSTMSKKLFDRINVNDKYLVQESSQCHPISENNFADMDVWQVKTLHNWEKLCAKITSQPALYVMEFVLFQNTIGQMLLNNYDRNQIGDYCHKIEHMIKGFSPALILYTANDPLTFLSETYELRGDEWKKVIDHLIDDTPYGQKRNLMGYDGFMHFFDEYISITNSIYGELEINRICIDVTRRDWPEVEKKTYEFLRI